MVCSLLSLQINSAYQYVFAANLDRNTPVAFEAHTRYTDGNETLVNELWDQINIDAGMVALPEDFALNNGLLIAQRFPWDRSRVVYLLNGYHSLHCIVRKTNQHPPSHGARSLREI